MKREYVTPIIEREEFVPNEYCKSCYKVHCQTPNNNDSYSFIYDDTNNSGELELDEDECVMDFSSGTFNGCNKVHGGNIWLEPEELSTAFEANGFVVKRQEVEGYYVPDPDSAVPVHWWNVDGKYKSDYHVMLPGDLSGVITTPLAS